MGRLGALLLPSLLAACHSASDNGSCRYEGTSYPSGASFSANDGCNTCSCSSDVGISCTHRTCLSDGGPADLGPPDSGSPADTGPPDVGPFDDGPAVATVICQSGSHVYAQDVFFPSDDGCNFCTCSAQGQIHCTAVFCSDGGGSALGCNFETTYRYSDQPSGADPSVEDSSTLTPPHHDQVSHTVVADGGMSTCEADLPCVDSARVDVVQIRQALAHPDVVAALAHPTPPTFGTFGVSTTEFHFRRDDGRGFDVGDGTVPAGVQEVVDLLRTLKTETTATCPAF